MGRSQIFIVDIYIRRCYLSNHINLNDFMVGKKFPYSQ